MSKMRLNIITPDGVIYDDDIEMVIVRSIDGDRGIMPQHEPLVTGVDIGEIRIKEEKEEYLLAATHGYMEVKPDKVVILAEAAEFAEDIDVERAMSAKERAENLLKKKESHINEKKAEIALEKALNRLQVARRKGLSKS